MTDTPKVSAIRNRGLQDDHDPSDIGQREANNQGIVKDERGQEQPADKQRAQQKTGKQPRSQMEGPAAYAPHDKDEKKQIKPKSSDKCSNLVGVVGDNDLA
jgi:hypothetical protein